MADGKLRTFTDEQWDTLILLLDRVRGSSVNTVQKQPEHTYMAPEVYVARVPSNGIPALDKDGTGTSVNDVAGKAECRIFKIDDDDGVSDAGFVKEIYNIQPDKAYTADQFSYFVPVIRTKFGRWIAAHFFGVYIGILNGELVKGGRVSMNIYKGVGAQGGNETATGDSILVYDWLLGVGQTVASGKKVIVIRIFGVPYVVAAQC